MRVTDQPAFILRRREWRNTSLLVDLLTRDHGCMRGLARGARSGGSSASWQPFEMLSIGWSGRGGLPTLTGAEGQSLPIEERNYLLLLYVNELLLSTLAHGDPAPELFIRYFELLRLASDTIGEPDLRRFELDLLRCQGYLPDLTRDAQSGEPIDSGRSYRYFADRGFVFSPGEDRDEIDGALIVAWMEDNYEDPAVRRLARLTLRATIDFILQGKTLKSRDVFQQIKGLR